MAKVILSMPEISEDSLRDSKSLRRIWSYLYQLNEQLRYQLTHIDDSNIAAEGLSERALSADLSRTLKNAEGEMTRLRFRAGQILLQVEKAGADMESMRTQISQNAQQILLKADAGALSDFGATNLLRASGLEAAIAAGDSAAYALSDTPRATCRYTVRVWTEAAGAQLSLYAGSTLLCALEAGESGTYGATFTWPAAAINERSVRIVNGGGAAVTIARAKLESGVVATDWSECPGEVHSSSVAVTAEGVDIGSDGHIDMDGGTVSIRSGGSLTMEAATDEDATINGGAIWHGKNMVVSTSQPANPRKGMVWLRPIGGDYAVSALGAGAAAAQANEAVYYNGTWTGDALSDSAFASPVYIPCYGVAQGAPPSGSYNCQYTVKVYFWKSAAIHSASAHVYLSNTSGGMDVDCGSQTFTASGWFEKTVTSNVWLGNGGTIFITVVKDVADFAVYKNKPFSVNATLTGASGSGETPEPISGFVACEAYYYAG